MYRVEELTNREMNKKRVGVEKPTSRRKLTDKEPPAPELSP